LTFVLAPRHQEKFEFYADFLSRLEIPFERYSELSGTPASKPVLLLDTLGQLERVYSFSAVSFVGGTLLSRYMGHNPLEPAMYGSCVVIGPYGATIAEVREDLLEAQGVLLIKSERDAEHVCELLLQQRATCESIGQKGRKVWLKHCGAADRIMEVVCG
jgi:3-deoxy-D-manno-octulosonic-acid transferase